MIEITRYMEFYKQNPQLFKHNENVKIIVDENQLKKYAVQKNCKLGIVFENKYFSLVVDLIENSTGTRYPYARIVHRNKYNGVVVIPILNNKIVFLKQFRHGTREFEIELPRGFSEKSKTIQENAESEVYEELGVMPKNIEYLGNVINDSSLSGGLVHIFVCEIEAVEKLSADEGIKDTIQLTLHETEEFINENKIRDCFSISAIYKLLLAKNRKEN